jgi:hypothetical protein
MISRCYSELIKLDTFKARYEYLKLKGKIADRTFGFDRYLNQTFYKSRLWQNIRESVIIRDNGLDLGFKDRVIVGVIMVHHMNPMSIKDLKVFNEDVINPEFLISTSFTTHTAIHYSKTDYIFADLDPGRFKGDTKLW